MTLTLHVSGWLIVAYLALGLLVTIVLIVDEMRGSDVEWRPSWLLKLQLAGALLTVAWPYVLWSTWRGKRRTRQALLIEWEARDD